MKKEGQKSPDDMSMPEADFDRMMEQAISVEPPEKSEKDEQKDKLATKARWIKECRNLAAMDEDDDSFQTMFGSLVDEMVQSGLKQEYAESETKRCIDAARADHARKP